MTLGDAPPDDAEDADVGYRRPPRTTRFTRGQSGNPAGRPRERRREAPHEAVLGQMVTIREGGAERRVTAAEAFLLQLTKRGLEGDGAAARESLALIEQARERQSVGQSQINAIVMVGVAPGSVTSALEPLRMARKLDPYRETARMALEPWLVEAALARLRQALSPADQRTIVKATRTPPQGQMAGVVERISLIPSERFDLFWRLQFASVQPPTEVNMNGRFAPRAAITVCRDSERLRSPSR
jgi:Family of unknown function (DUF5681)